MDSSIRLSPRVEPLPGAGRKEVRVRFAPSPTGWLHLGGARTALFNWLFARSQKGDFILRIEDTDQARSKPEFETDIKQGLEWLGLTWDEFYRQSDRRTIYRDYLKKLLEAGWLYYCFCRREELEAERQAMLAAGLTPKYSGRCRSLSQDEIESRLARGESYVLRFKMPETKISFRDLIRGNITFDMSLVGDMVVAKSFDEPLYNFAVTIDDALTKITHVIRGEDHIANTPRQILLLQALGFELPQFAHLPMILNPDRSKMSKRFADTALRDYIKAGYLKEAMVNFLVLLGWHPKEDREILSLSEMIQAFDLKRIQKGGAVFNAEKLDWLNSYYLRQLSADELAVRAKPFLPADWQLTPAMIESVKGRAGKLSDLPALLDFYFQLPDYPAELLRWQGIALEATADNLRAGRVLIEAIAETDFTKQRLEEDLLERIPQEKRGDILWPLRVALSGKTASPSPFEIMAVLGKQESLRRIDLALAKIQSKAQ